MGWLYKDKDKERRRWIRVSVGGAYRRYARSGGGGSGGGGNGSVGGVGLQWFAVGIEESSQLMTTFTCTFFYPVLATGTSS